MAFVQSLANSFGLDVAAQPVDHGVGLLATQQRREVAHDLGVGIEPGERFEVRLPPLPQEQSLRAKRRRMPVTRCRCVSCTAKCPVGDRARAAPDGDDPGLDELLDAVGLQER